MPLRCAVSVVALVPDRLAELINHNLRRTIGGIAHPQVDNVSALLAFSKFQCIQPPE